MHYWVIHLILFVASVLTWGYKSGMFVRVTPFEPILCTNQKNIIKNWRFSKILPHNYDYMSLISRSEEITTPHTWNNLDGQDGGNDYLRTQCVYQAMFTIPDKYADKKAFIEFLGVSMVATVYLNGIEIGKHIGGFATFRFDITSALKLNESNVLVVVVDNRPSQDYYPQQADFTFFGGIYRDVSLIFTNKTHFDKLDYGSSGIYITPKIIKDKDVIGHIDVKTLVIKETENTNIYLRYLINDAYGKPVFEKKIQSTTASFDIASPTLWNSIDEPYLYRLNVDLLINETVVDSVSSTFGFREFACTHDGFVINGETTQLRGVSRHQDRLDKGWAVSPEDEDEDFKLIHEMGANSVRLAHYQQSPHVLDICDRLGFVVWVEIPFISAMLNSTKAHENLRQQLTEMIKQNYNHPCVGMWGLMNEISFGGENEQMYESVKDLHNLAKSLDPTRMTAGAMLIMTKPESPLNQIPDIIGYNFYYGWYVGKTEDTAEAIDNILNISDNHPLAITEYGAEANLNYHSEKPAVQDYSEEYQLQYHIDVYNIIKSKKVWGSYVWNMFDFAADSRDEGGVRGRNNKGLVTYDRKTKKDSFYFYKAMWGDEPFVHICGSRFHDRTVDMINVTIYSNIDRMEYIWNNKPIPVDKKFSKIHVLTLKLNMGKNVLRVGIGSIYDQVEFERVEKANTNYILKSSNPDDDKYDRIEGCFSVFDKIGEIMANEEAYNVLKSIIHREVPQEYVKIVENMQLIRVLHMIGGALCPAYKIRKINQKLNAIPKNK